jgi:hypothetical protein
MSTTYDAATGRPAVHLGLLVWYFLCWEKDVRDTICSWGVQNRKRAEVRDLER